MSLSYRFALLAATSLVAAASAIAAPTAVDGFAAVVNTRIITVGDVLEYVAPTESQLREVYSGDELQQKREQIYTSGLEALIDQALILEDFKSRQAEIPERLVNDRINEIIFDRFNNDRALFQQALVDQQTTLEEWRDQIRDRLIVTFLRRQEVTDKVKLSPNDVRRAYNERAAEFTVPLRVRLNVIVLNRGSTPEEQEVKRQQAIMVRGKLLAGEEFSFVAMNVSEGSKAAQGGDWGWMQPSDLRVELKNAVAAMKENDISDIIETENELYIVKVAEIQPEHVTPYEEVKDKIEQELKENEGLRLYKAWMERLRRKFYVQIFVDEGPRED